MFRGARVLAGLLVLCAVPAAHADVEINMVSSIDPRVAEEQERERQEALRRERQLIDDELARRGWPRSREAEVRRFLALQKQAAALAPKPGAGALLNGGASSDARTEWEKRSYDASSGKKKPGLIATPEAIVVCTRPTPAGNFVCDTPVDTNLRGGPANDLAEWRTPESMIAWMQGACSGARRLASSTHLVWGCGYGATGNSNTVDRSAGVDVQGRATYYCTELQTGCRRTAPGE